MNIKHEEQTTCRMQGNHHVAEDTVKETAKRRDIMIVLY